MCLSETKKSEEDDDATFIKDMINTQNSQLDSLDKNSLAYLTGYILKHTIMLSSKCETCRIAFTSNVDSPLQEANTLISIKDYRAGALVRPSEVANAMFERAEKIFRSQRDSLAGQKMIWNKI